MGWCSFRGGTLETIEPMVVAAYIEQLTQEKSPSTVKQRLAALRMLFDWLVAARLAGHASTKTTQLYDRTSNKVDLGGSGENTDLGSS